MPEPGELPADEVEVLFDTSKKPKRVKMALLTMPSPVFERMLSHDMREKKRRRIELPGKDPKEFNELISFLTSGTGRLQQISKENVTPLLTWCDEYGIDSLRDECLEFIEKQPASPKMVELAFIHKQHPKMDAYIKNSIKELFNRGEYNWGPKCKDPELVRYVFEGFVKGLKEQKKSKSRYMVRCLQFSSDSD